MQAVFSVSFVSSLWLSSTLLGGLVFGTFVDMLCFESRSPKSIKFTQKIHSSTQTFQPSIAPAGSPKRLRERRKTEELLCLQAGLDELRDAPLSTSVLRGFAQLLCYSRGWVCEEGARN